MTENEVIEEITEESVPETAEVIEVTYPDRPFLTTNFEDYTVTEGLLLLLVILFVVKWIVSIVKGGFKWLW